MRTKIAFAQLVSSLLRHPTSQADNSTVHTQSEYSNFYVFNQENSSQSCQEANLIWVTLHRCTQTFLSWSSLDPANMTDSINFHR